MGNIPTIRFDESMRTGPIGTYTRASDFTGGGPSPEDVANIQQGIQGINRVLQRQKDALDSVWVQDQTIQFQKNWSDRLKALQDAKNRGEDVDPDKVLEEFNRVSEETFNTAPTHVAGTEFMSKMQPMGLAVYEQALHMKAEKMNQTYAERVSANMASLTQSAGENPSNIQAVLENINKTSTVYGPAMPGMEAFVEKQRVNARNDAILRAVDSDIQKGGAVALEMLNAGVLDELPKPVADAARAKIHNAVNQQEAVITQKWEKLRQDNMVSLAETGRPAAGYDAMADAAFTSKNPDYTMAKFMDLQEQQGFYMELHSLKNNLYGKSPQEAAAFLDTIKPAPGAENFDNKNKLYDAGLATYTKMQQEMRQDPYKFSLGAPVIAGYRDRAQSYFTQAQAEQDPEKKKQLTALGQEQIVSSIAASLDFQAKAGVPSDRQTVMSREEATAFADTIKNGLLKDGLATISNIESTYGPYTAKAFADLQRLPQDGSKLDGKFMVVVSHSGNPVFAQVLLDAVKLDSSRVKDGAVLKSSLDADIGDANVKAMQVAADGNKTLTAYKQATMATSGNTKYAMEVQQAVVSYAKLLMSRKAPGSNTPEQAMQTAADHVIGNLYAFGSSQNGELYGVPKQGKSPEQVETVIANVNDVTRKLNDVAFLESRGVDMTQFAGGTAGNMGRYNANGLSKKSYWATLPDNSGIGLYANDDTHSTLGLPGQPIRLKDGSHFVLTFEELSRPRVAANPGENSEDTQRRAMLQSWGIMPIFTP